MLWANFANTRLLQGNHAVQKAPAQNKTKAIHWP